jgi:hypothetical protein
MWYAVAELAKRGGHASELDMMGDAPDRYEAMAVENMLLPALVRGFAVSGATVHGEARYSLTDAGRTWLRGDDAQAATDADTAADDEASALYEQTLVAALHRLGTQSPRDSREIGLLPLPAGARQCPLGLFQARDMGVVSEKKAPGHRAMPTNQEPQAT